MRLVRNGLTTAARIRRVPRPCRFVCGAGVWTGVSARLPCPDRIPTSTRARRSTLGRRYSVRTEIDGASP